MGHSKITFDSWLDHGTKLYGEDRLAWKFRCPICKIEQSIALFKEHTSMTDDEIRQRVVSNCIGRHAPGGPKKPSIGCDYTLGGLLDFSTYSVFDGTRFYSIFGFADGEIMPDENPQMYVELDKLIEATGDAPAVAWPDWVTEPIRKQIAEFWGCFGRTPKSYFAAWKENLAPDFGSEPSFTERGEEIKGRFVYAWNNIGRMVQPDGTHKMVGI